MRPPRAVRIGDAAVDRQIGPITQTHIVRFAGAGGDFNPLHHDGEFAAAAGFRGVIAMGQLQAGILAGYISDWLGVENLRELEVRFVAPVHIGDLLELAAEITTIDRGVATVSAIAQVSGKAVVTASAMAVVIDR